MVENTIKLALPVRDALHPSSAAGRHGRRAGTSFFALLSCTDPAGMQRRPRRGNSAGAGRRRARRGSLRRPSLGAAVVSAIRHAAAAAATTIRSVMITVTATPGAAAAAFLPHRLAVGTALERSPLLMLRCS